MQTYFFVCFVKKSFLYFCAVLVFFFFPPFLFLFLHQQKNHPDFPKKNQKSQRPREKKISKILRVLFLFFSFLVAPICFFLFFAIFKTENQRKKVSDLSKNVSSILFLC
jgi:hypothetical protein